jgi:ubiquinone/menaquinone biosynthesis C-methylase UbiE
MYIRLLKAQPVNKWNQKRTTMQRYDLTAKMYDARYAEEQAAKYNAALKHLIFSQDSILDVGCGSGLLFSHIAEAQTVVGVDISRKLLLQAKERIRDLPNVHLVQADADYLPLKNACFGVVFAFTVLQNLPKPLDTLKEFKRIVEGDAYIVVTGLKKAFSLEAFRGLLQKSGLQVVYLEDSDVLKCHVAVTMQSKV